MNNENPSKKKEITSLLSVIFGGGAFAVIVAIGLVYFYGPTGLYDAKHSLLSPDMLAELRYQDVNPQTGARNYFVYDGLEFTYFDQKAGKWKKESVSQEQYRKFYEVITSDVSIEQENDLVTDQFRAGYPAMLKILVHSEDRRSQATKTFQEVTFAFQGNYYRIELHEQASQEVWAYFFHEDIYKTAIEILK